MFVPAGVSVLFSPACSSLLSFAKVRNSKDQPNWKERKHLKHQDKDTNVELSPDSVGLIKKGPSRTPETTKRWKKSLAGGLAAIDWRRAARAHLARAK